jgi:hypothetical protein
MSVTLENNFQIGFLLFYRITKKNSLLSKTIGLNWIRLDWIRLDWIGLDWIGLDWS